MCIRDRCRLILETLEDDHAHKEPASYERATIEHVLPQTMSPEWRLALGADADALHEEWSDTIGNLTLTGYNSELSNSPFAEKRALLEKSNFVLNRWIAARDVWDAATIQERAGVLFAKASKIWGGPPVLTAPVSEAT